jgi:hypothetical protein
MSYSFHFWGISPFFDLSFRFRILSAPAIAAAAVFGVSLPTLQVTLARRKTPSHTFCLTGIGAMACPALPAEEGGRLSLFLLTATGSFRIFTGIPFSNAFGVAPR